MIHVCDICVDCVYYMHTKVMSCMIHVYIPIYLWSVCMFKYQSPAEYKYLTLIISKIVLWLTKFKSLSSIFIGTPLEESLFLVNMCLPVALWLEMKVSSKSYQKCIITAICEVISCPHQTIDIDIVLNIKYIYIFKIVTFFFMYHGLIMLFRPQTI